MYLATKDKGENEEGELMLDEPEKQQDDFVSNERKHGFSIREGAGSGDEGDDAVEIASPNNDQVAHNSVGASMLNDVDDVIEDFEKFNTSNIDQATLVFEQSPKISTKVPYQSLLYSQQNLVSGKLTTNASAEIRDS